MARPKNEQPTPAELELLKIVWERGPCTVRDVLDDLQDRGDGRAYTSVMSLMNVMAEKRLLRRKAHGRAFVYSARATQESTLGGLVGDLCRRAFEGSAKTLVTHLLQESELTVAELEEIHRLIEQHRRVDSDGRIDSRRSVDQNQAGNK